MVRVEARVRIKLVGYSKGIPMCLITITITWVLICKYMSVGEVSAHKSII